VLLLRKYIHYCFLLLPSATTAALERHSEHTNQQCVAAVSVLLYLLLPLLVRATTAMAAVASALLADHRDYRLLVQMLLALAQAGNHS
jgi:hypothetical protein